MTGNSASRGNTNVAWAVAGIAFGAAAMWLFQPRPTAELPAPPTASLVEATDVSLDEAESLRKSDYASLSTIGDILSLPGDFAEAEATYALASRADAAGLQNLIYQAAAVIQPVKREVMIRILLTRLTELDPLTALALADGPLSRFRTDHASAVWRVWASRDFDSALAAATQRTEGRRRIARALYGALPSLEDDRARKIEAALGTAPDGDVRAQELGRLYARSVDLAINQFNLTAGKDNTALTKELAALLLAEHDIAALEYLDDITDPSLRRQLRKGILQTLAETSPAKAIAVIVKNGWESSAWEPLGDAIGKIAEEDPERAFQLLADVSPGVRRRLEADIIVAVAKTDFIRASTMVDQAKYATRKSLVRRLVSATVKTNLPLAIELVKGIEDPREQGSALQALGFGAAVEDLTQIADLALSLADDGWSTNGTLKSIARRWAQEDPDAALDWAQSLPEKHRAGSVAQVVGQIADRSPEKAMALVAALTGPDSDKARQSLASSLANMDMVDEALSLAAAASTEDSRRSIQLAALSRLIEADAERAMTLAAQVGDKDIQDVILARALSTGGRTDPIAALERMEEIDNPELKLRLEYRVINELARQDPAAARTRVDAMPRGERYDNAAAGLSRSPGLEPDEALRIAATIDDDRKRSYAQFQVLSRLARTDATKARTMAKNVEMSDKDRDNFELFLLQRGIRYW